MIRYGLRAAPWALVLTACIAAGALMTLVAARPFTMWPLEGTTVGLLAAAAAWAMDEPAAAIVDTLPRSLRWRTAGRATAVVPLALAWLACLHLARGRLPPHAGVLVLEGLTALLVGVALATARRAHGSSTPGTRLGSGTVAIAATLALVRPLPATLPLFPVWPWDPWTRSTDLWEALMTASMIALCTTLTYRAGFPVCHRPTGAFSLDRVLRHGSSRPEEARDKTTQPQTGRGHAPAPNHNEE